MIISLAGSSVRPRFMSIIAGGDLVFSTDNETIARVQVDSGTFVFDKSVPQINNPFGVAIESDGSILVIDKSSKTLHRVSSKGNWIEQLWSVPSDGDQEDELLSVSVDRPRRSSTTHLSVRQVHADTQTCTASQSCTRGRLLDDRVRPTMSSRRTHRLLRPTGPVLSKTTIGIGRHDQTGSVFNHGPPSGQGAGSGDRTRDRRVPADLRADSQATVLPTPPLTSVLDMPHDKRKYWNVLTVRVYSTPAK
ncbi:hypothetical protein PoB_004903600 [Plakobranchus ocellatus]|uniref:Uncharacterized protein n=1 Tax=Plakobranchus ocellatus TaxID=259542 RepID=A0AAV4BTZ2_9GAST|nr:hypothetical protein PoB_004903600 [Plakobranchus ocellatus]